MTIEQVELSRRNFLIGSAVAGAGLSISMSLPAQGMAVEASAATEKEVNAWVVVNPDDTVVIRIARSEMGQGTLTGLAQLVAEELDCDWEKVTTEFPTPGDNLRRDNVWGSMATGGSWGIRTSQQYVREGGAAARMMLIQAAAQTWGVPVRTCSAESSVITHTPTGKTMTYGDVATAAAKIVPPKKVPLKDPKDWKIAGQSKKRLDTKDKLDGSQIYPADLKFDGMLNAAIKACPTFGGKLASFDAKAATKMPGVKKVVAVNGDAVAVIAEKWWQAKTALDQVQIKWNRGDNANWDSKRIDDWLTEGLTADDAVAGNQNGDVEAGLKSASKTIEAVYDFPYQAHATMEPMTATVRWTPDRCEAWVGTQSAGACLKALAKSSGLPIEQCDVYKINLGGGFGRRGGFDDYVDQATKLAMEFPNTHVKLMWTREEDMQHGHYHPVTKAKMVAGFDENGDVTGMHMRIAGQSILAAVFPRMIKKTGVDMFAFQGILPSKAIKDQAISYTIPNFLADFSMRNPPVPPGFWRGVNINQNTVYLECFMDEMAHAAGKDALEFRRQLMQQEDHPKSLAVLEAVAEKSGWGKKDGRFRGLAVTRAFGSHVAACAEISVQDDGSIKMERIVAATDPGYAVNPQQIQAQVSGSFVYGLSAMLYGECTLKDGAIEQTNFHDFPSLKMAQMPDVETIVMPSGGFWGGVGEPTIAVAAPAVLNAIFAATGKRIRKLPLTKYSDIRIA